MIHYPVSVGQVNNVLGNKALRETFQADVFHPQEMDVFSGKGGTIDPSRVSEVALQAFGTDEKFYPASFSATLLGYTGKFCPELAYHVSEDATFVSFELLGNGSSVTLRRNVGGSGSIYGHRHLKLQAIG